MIFVYDYSTLPSRFFANFSELQLMFPLPFSIVSFELWVVSINAMSSFCVFVRAGASVCLCVSVCMYVLSWADVSPQFKTNLCKISDECGKFCKISVECGEIT